MNADGFSTLHGGMLVRKGRAEPSAPSTLSMPGKSDSPAPEWPGFAADRRDSRDGPAGTEERLNLGSCVETPPGISSKTEPGLLTVEERRALRFAAVLLDTSDEALINTAVRAHLEHLANTALSQCPCFRKRLEEKSAAD